MLRADRRVEYISYCASYMLAFIFSKMGAVYPSGIVLILEALLLYVLNFRSTNNLVNLRGLFSLSWIGGEGIACLKLSRLSSQWEIITWFSFFLAYFCFMLGYDVWEKKAGFQQEDLQQKISKQEAASEVTACGIKQTEKGTCNTKIANKKDMKNDVQACRVMLCIILLGIASLFCFLLEAVVLGYIPLFAPEPHAYSYFHISGVHYFTVSCILIPALSVLYVKLVERWTTLRVVVLVVGNVLAISIPILCVSRFQLLFAVGFAAVVYLMLYRHITWKMVVGAVVILIPVYVLLTVARRHDIPYLNGIFEMKYSKMPIFITQPYMYVANNYENFNCLVCQLPAFTKGIRMLFPVFALTGLKFIFPQVAALPLYITKEELTTLTIFYDAYYDFGIPGIIFFALVLGGVAAGLNRWVRKSRNPVCYLFYGQFAIYLGLSFFTTWFSNPTTWFWLALTLAMYLLIGYEKKASDKIDQKRKQKQDEMDDECQSD